jgi:hypothetical protein
MCTDPSVSIRFCCCCCIDICMGVVTCRRGLSSFFSGRSRSFANLLDAASAVGSARDLAKPENPFNKRRRVLRCCSVVRRAASTTSLAALPPIAGGDDNDDDGRSVPS